MLNVIIKEISRMVGVISLVYKYNFESKSFCFWEKTSAQFCISTCSAIWLCKVLCCRECHPNKKKKTIS